MNGIQPQLWVNRAGDAVKFYGDAFGARVLHLVGEGDEIVAQLSIGSEGCFWIASADGATGRISPTDLDGATGRILLVVDDPDVVVRSAVAAGADALSPVQDEHGWRLGRVVDPFGHEWEIGRPLGTWPPS
jgi:PhnB protein